MQMDTIVAIATASGKGGVGIVRVSGPQVQAVIGQLLKKTLLPRIATLSQFYDAQKYALDEGIALYFPSPHSYTGEDVLELQGHGGPVVLNQIVDAVVSVSGVRTARPGEFSERAFLNDKLDLAQAEAVADLIEASSTQAARSAMQSLQGVFSNQVKALVEQLIQLRMYVEAAIDFPEEEEDFLSENHIEQKVLSLYDAVQTLGKQAQVGLVLKEGMSVVIAGKPNAGKSSLLNALAGQDRAIVTNVPGTTRDVLKEHIQVQGVPLHVIDTAGLRESSDVIEQEGVRRAHQSIQQADHILWVVDATETHVVDEEIKRALKCFECTVPVTIIFNKVDLIDQESVQKEQLGIKTIYLSAKQGDGISLLSSRLLAVAGFNPVAEGVFMARRRHIKAIEAAMRAIQHGLVQLKTYRAGELLAEDLRQAQQELSSITGQFTADDLLGEIFSQFCMGK